ncbi:MAG: glycosyltransferase [Syntrophobacter sp.]
MNRRILHLITGLEIGGTEMMLLRTLPGMQRAFDNRVCCIKGRGPVGAKLRKAGVPVYYLDLKKLFDPDVLREFQGIVKSFRPDVLVTYLIHADLIGRILGRVFGIPKVVCSVRAKLIQPKYFLFTFIDGLTSFLVSSYHFNSEAVADMYRRYLRIPGKKIMVIPNGTVADCCPMSSTDVRAKRRELGLPPDKKVIGCVANFRKQKGHTYLIEGFREVLRERDDVILLLVGDGKERGRIEGDIRQRGLSGHVLIVSDRDDIPEILAVMDVFVLPTLFEGMSNALIEAMAAGKAIVTSDIAETREIIEDQKTGILVPTRNAELIKAAIVRLLTGDGLSKTLGFNARQRAISDFSLDNTVSRMCSFLANV